MLISSLSMFQHLFECTSVPRLGAPFVLKKTLFSPLAIRLGAVYIGLRASQHRWAFVRAARLVVRSRSSNAQQSLRALHNR